jgi:streptogramin lyase
MTPAGFVTRFPVPTAGACASGITSGPDGNLWFTEHYRNKIGRMTPDGQVTEFRIGPVDQNFPNEIVTGPDGNLWATSNFGVLHKVTPMGVITDIPASAYGPLTAGGGYLWTGSTTAISRVSTTGTIQSFNLPDSDHTPLGIAFGSDGAVWFPEIYTNSIDVNGYFQ